MSNIRKISGNPGDTWDDLSWTDMNNDEQALWATLGWNEASWEEDSDAPDSNEKYWEDLTENERDAATKLGYNQWGNSEYELGKQSHHREYLNVSQHDVPFGFQK